jgi:hypothetical protein
MLALEKSRCGVSWSLLTALHNVQFLTELTLLYERTRDKGSVFTTMKRRMSMPNSEKCVESVALRGLVLFLIMFSFCPEFPVKLPNQREYLERKTMLLMKK